MSTSHPSPAVSASSTTIAATTAPLSSSSSALVTASGSIAPPAAATAPVMSAEQMTAAILDLGRSVAAIHAFLAGPHGPQPLTQSLSPQQPALPLPYSQQILPAPSLPSVQHASLAPTRSALPAATASTAAGYIYGMPHDGAPSSAALIAQPPPPHGVPITQIPFPRSPSRIPGRPSETAPVYTSAPVLPYVPPPPSSGPVVGHGGVPASGILYGGVDGPLFHGGSLQPSSSLSPARDDTAGGAVSVIGPEPPPPKFYKLEF
ncbi:uncharacterized protein [Miscanthus floridulus]|uniref:uncharacterized protein n=1 Tax=Miscanthus floridulus TaxID=154761 RepID=UPI0034578AE4